MKSFYLIIFLGLMTSVALLQNGCKLLSDSTEPPELIIEPPDEANNISIIQPTYGTIYNPGDTIKIKWIAPTIETIQIQLYRKNEFKLTIVQNIENIGVYSWNIPFDLPLSNHYLIKISSYNNENIFKFSRQFGIQ